MPRGARSPNETPGRGTSAPLRRSRAGRGAATRRHLQALECAPTQQPSLAAPLPRYAGPEDGAFASFDALNTNVFYCRRCVCMKAAFAPRGEGEGGVGEKVKCALRRLSRRRARVSAAQRRGGGLSPTLYPLRTPPPAVEPSAGRTTRRLMRGGRARCSAPRRVSAGARARAHLSGVGGGSAWVVVSASTSLRLGAGERPMADAARRDAARVAEKEDKRSVHSIHLATGDWERRPIIGPPLRLTGRTPRHHPSINPSINCKLVPVIGVSLAYSCSGMLGPQVLRVIYRTRKRQGQKCITLSCKCSRKSPQY